MPFLLIALAVLIWLSSRQGQAPQSAGSIGSLLTGILPPAGSLAGGSLAATTAAAPALTNAPSSALARSHTSSAIGSQGSMAQNGTMGAAVTDSIGSDADILARTIYGEARGEVDSAKLGVASVVMNRVANGFSYPGGLDGVAAVCQARNQFSCWNANDPNRSVCLAVTASDPVFQRCLQIAAGAIDGTLSDNTAGATYYHDLSIGTPARWGNVVQTAAYGRLVFFRPA